MVRRVARSMGAGAMIWCSACIGQTDDGERPEGTFTHPATQTPDASGDRDAAAPSSGLDGGASIISDGSTLARDGASPEGDAGSPSARDDAGGNGEVDATAPPTEVGCPGLFCENFESGSLDAAVWNRLDTDNADNSVAVQGAVVAHGRFAVRFHARGGTSRAMMFNDALPDALRTHYFGRASMRIKGFPTENGGHTAYLSASASRAGYPYTDSHMEIGHYFSDNAPIWQLTYAGNGAEYIGAGGHIPQDQWFCIEWEFNDRPNAIAVWVNGSVAPNGAEFRNINGNSSNLLGGLATLGLGFRTFHPMGAPDTDVYFDDLVLDTKRIPCLTP